MVIEILTALCILLINVGVAMQAFHIYTVKRVEGLNVWSWGLFTVCLFVLGVFTIVEQQHILLVLNYCVSAALHGATFLLILMGRRER